MTDPTLTVGRADAELDKRLSRELDEFNAAANPDVDPAEEVTVRVEADAFRAGDWHEIARHVWAHLHPNLEACALGPRAVDL
jgi:hypothetical protein